MAAALLQPKIKWPSVITTIHCKEAILKLQRECCVLQVDQQQDDQNTEILYTKLLSIFVSNNWTILNISVSILI